MTHAKTGAAPMTRLDRDEQRVAMAQAHAAPRPPQIAVTLDATRCEAAHDEHRALDARSAGSPRFHRELSGATGSLSAMSAEPLVDVYEEDRP
jgi:hypothetical protein